jgi:transposase
MERLGLRDDQWNRIKDILPGREGHVGGTAPDNRLFVEAVLYRFRTGVPWRYLPPRFGYWKSVHQRFGRWAKSGVFKRIFELLASEADNEYMMIDATIVRAHQHSAGAQRRRPGDRSFARRIDNENSRPCRCLGQSRQLDAYGRTDPRFDDGGSAVACVLVSAATICATKDESAADAMHAIAVSTALLTIARVRNYSLFS